MWGSDIVPYVLVGPFLVWPNKVKKEVSDSFPNGMYASLLHANSLRVYVFAKMDVKSSGG